MKPFDESNPKAAIEKAKVAYVAALSAMRLLNRAQIELPNELEEIWDTESDYVELAEFFTKIADIYRILATMSSSEREVSNRILRESGVLEYLSKMVERGFR